MTPSKRDFALAALSPDELARQGMVWLSPVRRMRERIKERRNDMRLHRALERADRRKYRKLTRRTFSKP